MLSVYKNIIAVLVTLTLAVLINCILLAVIYFAIKKYQEYAVAVKRFDASGYYSAVYDDWPSDVTIYILSITLCLVFSYVSSRILASAIRELKHK